MRCLSRATLSIHRFTKYHHVVILRLSPDLLAEKISQDKWNWLGILYIARREGGEVAQLTEL